MLINSQKLARLLSTLTERAQQQTCYDLSPNYNYPEHKWDVFEDGVEYGEVTFARTLLAQLENDCGEN